MAKANYVGRVGALAVALGVGTAVLASPGAALAQPGDDTSSSDSAGSSADRADSPQPEGADQNQQGADTDDGDDEQGADTDDDGDDEQVESDDGPVDTDNEPADTDDEPGDDDTSKPKRRSSHGSRHDDAAPDRAERSVEADSGVNGAEPETVADPDPAESTADSPASTQVDDEPGDAPPGTSVSLDDLAAEEVEEVEEAEAPASTPVRVLQTVFAPLTTRSANGPAAPIETPLLWTILAFTRRQFEQRRAEIAQTGAPVGTTELVEDVDNSDPVPGEVTTGDPGYFTGSISGRVTATDPDGDRLTFSGSTTNDKGRVTVLSSGRFVYTPTAAARHAAAADNATAEQKVNTFTVTITDSAGNTATQLVTLDISPTNSAPFGARARAGAGNLTTGSVVVTVSGSDFDGDPLTFSGPASTDKGTLIDNGDGTFTYTPTAAAREAAGAPGAPADAKTDTLTFTVSDGHGGIRTATVTVAVTPYGEVSSSTPGKAAGPVVVSSNGTIYQVTYDVDPTTMLPTRTRVSILDENGQVLKTTGDIAGSPLEQTLPVVRSDGSLVLTTYKPATNTSTISIVDGSGTVTTVGTVIGQPSAPLKVAPNGAVYLQTRQFASGSGDRLVRISATNSLRVYRVGKAGGTLTVAPDGSAYLVGSTPLLGTPSLLAVGPDGSSRTIALPSGTVTPEDVVIGSDGHGYFTVAQTSFGTTVTRVYTFTGTSSTVREIPGSPVRAEVVTADGVYQATYDASTGKSYISRITADTIEISDAIDGSIVNAISVTPDGTVYASVRNSVTQTDSVAVVTSEGDVTTVAVPGAIVLVAPRVSPSVGGYDANPNIGDNGYVAYTSAGKTYLAVLNPDGTIARTVALPDGAVITTPVTFGPDGAAYQVIENRDADGRVTSEAVLALADDAVTATLPGSPLRPNYDAIQFGPDGTGFLVTVEAATFTHHILGFDQNGATVVTLDVTGPLVPQQVNGNLYQAPLAFGADGTAYVTLAGADAGVWALTPEGATKVLDLDLEPGETVNPVAFGPDGTPYVTVTDRVGNQYVTSVQTFTPPTVL